MTESVAVATELKTCLRKRKQALNSVARATLSVTSRHDDHDLSPKTLRPRAISGLAKEGGGYSQSNSSSAFREVAATIANSSVPYNCASCATTYVSSAGSLRRLFPVASSSAGTLCGRR